MIRALGRGPGRARSLMRDEAYDAMNYILRGEAAPEAVGALLMLLRYRGETAPEIAGMVQAVRAHHPHWQHLQPAIDWPTYAAGRSRGLPWFLLSAKLLAQQGMKVVLHGWNSHQSAIADIRSQLVMLNIPQVTVPADAAQALAETPIVYLPLEALSPDLYRLVRLRDTLGLRSCVNTLLRMFNPCDAALSIQGVFHPSYRLLQQEAALLLGQTELLVVKGAGGEFERHPGKRTELFGLKNGQVFDVETPALLQAKRRLAESEAHPDDVRKLWQGTLDNPFAEQVVIGTTALILWRKCDLDSFEAADALAHQWWRARHASIPSMTRLERCA